MHASPKQQGLYDSVQGGVLLFGGALGEGQGGIRKRAGCASKGSKDSEREGEGERKAFLEKCVSETVTEVARAGGRETETTTETETERERDGC